MKRSRSGFTIVELIIVIVVIAILATVTLVLYSNSQAQARDTRRIADVHAIAEAIGLYRLQNGNDVQGGSGCGSGGGGSGWFNYSGGSYPASILSCLQNAGYLNGSGGSNGNFVDPTGCTVSTGSGSAAGSPLGYCHGINGNYYSYMKYSSGSGDTSVTCVYARLETQDDTSTLTSSSNPCYAASSATVATSYHMNYEVLVQ